MVARWFILSAFFITVLGARWWVVGEFGTGMPYYDQWGGESRVLAKWQEGDFGLGDLLAAHNEHRIAWSRLLWIAVYEVNGRLWDNLPTLYAMAVIASVAATVTTAGYLALTGWKNSLAVILGGLAAFALPLGWLNMVGGFQVQFPMQLLLGVGGLMLVVGAGGVRDVRWWLGLLVCAAGILAAGSGLLVGAGLAFGVIWKWISERRAGGFDWLTLGGGMAVLVAGVLAGLGTGVGDNRFRAAGVGDFTVALLRNLSWPWHDVLWPSLLLWMPLAGLLLAGICGRWRPSKGDVFLVMAGAYVFAQLVALSYSRGVNGMAPHDRHFDIHALGMFLNFLAILRARNAMPVASGVFRKVLLLCESAWCIMALAGIMMLSCHHLTKRLPDWRQASERQVKNVRAYLAAGLDHSLLEGLGRLDLPVDSPEIVAREVAFAHGHGILPFVLRPNLINDFELVEGGFGRDQIEIPDGLDALADDVPVVLSTYAPAGGEGLAQSGIVISKHGWLLFELAGMTPAGKLGMYALHEDGSRERLAVKEVDAASEGKGWRTAYAAVPAGKTVRVLVEDRRPGGWFALANVRDAGALTVLAVNLGSHAPVLFVWSLAVLLAVLFVLHPPVQEP